LFYSFIFLLYFSFVKDITINNILITSGNTTFLCNSLPYLYY
jgi:hypothetical protein